MGQSSIKLDLHWKGNNSQSMKSRSDDVGAPPPPLPPACCHQCGFVSEPACFLRSFASALSSSPLTKDLGISSRVTFPREPLSSLEAHGIVESPAVPMMNGENIGHV